METSAVISELSDSVKAQVNDFSTNGVVSSGEVVGGILLSGDQLLRVEELSVGSGSDFINDSWLKSRKTDLGTCLPAPVSLKKVLKASSPPPMVLSDGICPSG